MRRDDRDPASRLELGNRNRRPGLRIERADHIRKGRHAPAVVIRRHVLVVDAEHDLAAIAAHAHAADVEPARIGDGVLDHLAYHQQFASEELDRRSDSVRSIGAEHGAAELELERDCTCSAVLFDECGRERPARRVDQAAVHHRCVAHHRRGAHDVAFDHHVEPRAVGLIAAAADLEDAHIRARGEPHAAHLHGRMAATVRCRVDVGQAEHSGDQPRVEARHVPADHAGRWRIEQRDEAARCIEAIARRHQRLGKARRADGGRGDDHALRRELIEADEINAAEIERHPALHAVAVSGALPAAAGGEEQSADQRRLKIVVI